MPKCRWLLLALVASGLGTTGWAEAERPPPTIVLQAHVGAHPPISNEHVRPLLEELEKLGFAARPESILRALGDRAPLPGIRDAGVTAEEIRHAIDAGFHAFTQGRFEDAITRLEAALDRMRRNPAVIVVDTNNLSSMHKALVALAICHARRRNLASSVETMGELIRVFPTQPLSRANYGPEAFELYRSVAKQVQAMGRATLSVEVDNEHAVIFVDGQIRGMHRVELGDLVPGTYRVFIQVPGSKGRRYALEVSPNDQRELKVTWSVDSALHVTEQWVGLLFAREAAQATEKASATALARRWGSTSRVAVIGTVDVQGRAGVIGTIYRGDGAIVRSAIVADEANATSLRSLARFLADGTEADGISVVGRVNAPRPSREGRPSTAARTFTPAAKVLTAVGVGGMIAGGVLIAIDEDDTGETYTYRDSARIGVVVGAVGLTAIGIGIWRWLRADGDARSTPVVGATAGGALVGWARRF